MFFISLLDHVMLTNVISKHFDCVIFCSTVGKLLADKLDNEACKAYGSFPDRLYIVDNGKIVYQGGLGPFEYKVIAK